MPLPKLITSAVLATVAVFAQPPESAPRLTFKVVSIKSSEESEARCAPNASVGQIFAVTNCSIGNLVLFAYDVLQKQITGDTSLFSEEYDITADAGHPVSRAEMRRMLQALLQDLFKLTLRRETKETPVYALLVGADGPKFHATPAASEAGPKLVPGNTGEPILQNAAMSDMVFALSRRLPDRLVVDKTALEGRYDFEMAWYLELGKPNPPSVFAAVQKIGLKLEPQNSPVDFLIIDHLALPKLN
jgi:uncharacterized protein (TIGR03435 family)